MLKVLGIVTARGGSKGIPRKNLAMVAGKPLLAYTAEAARAARRLDRVILSTEDEEIARVGRELGLEVPFMRPAELARDDTPTLPVLQDTVRRLEAEGYSCDAVFTLQPTSPLRLPSDIDGAVELMERTGCDSVVGFKPVGGNHPARMKMVDEATGRVSDPPFAQAVEGQPRQLLPRLFLSNGAVYLTRRRVLMEGNSIKGADCRAWIMPPERSVDVDTALDLMLVEVLLGHR